MAWSYDNVSLWVICGQLRYCHPTKYLQLAIPVWDIFFSCFWFSFLTIICASYIGLKLYLFYLCLCWCLTKDHGWAYIPSNLSIDLSIDWSIYWSIYWSIDQLIWFICPSVYLRIHPSITILSMCVRLSDQIPELHHPCTILCVYPSITILYVSFCDQIPEWNHPFIILSLCIHLSIHPSITILSMYVSLYLNGIIHLPSYLCVSLYDDVCEFIGSNTWMKS